ncbi:hypothetical protein I4F81_002030 [Pyropia yezoensis]|uniref:Uncharacterized protein n=1 Tax=Pyropia yezoensis TaxID=2788 RepID=A0ACC3BNX4_PYRYE|nr:hypothetical protein I4F81_002030 [Neopyropia yezoensis]
MAFGGSGALPKRILKVRGGEGLGSWRAGGCSEGARQSPEWKREEKVPGPCCMGWEVDCLCTRERHVAEHGARRGCVGVSPVRRRCRDRWREVAAGGYLQTVWAPADAVVWVHCFIEWLGVSYLALGVAQETERLLSDPVPGINAVPHDDNARYFSVVILGPQDSPYAGGTFRLELFLPDDYPMAPPKVRFLTRLYHPNIDRLGRICLDVIKKMWSPALQIRTVLLSIQALLAAPNPEDPLNNEAADLWKRDEEAALAKAREWTRLYASDTPSA